VSLAKPVHWLGTHWACTAFGIERRDETFRLEASKLWDQDWMADREAAGEPDMDGFWEALKRARAKYHKLRPK